MMPSSESHPMAAMSQLPAILARLDSGLDASLERLSSWLEIPSIGTDPAFNAQTREAAEWLRADLEGRQGDLPATLRARVVQSDGAPGQCPHLDLAHPTEV